MRTTSSLIGRWATRCFYHNGLRAVGQNAWSGSIALTSAPSQRPLLYSLRISRPNFRAPLNCYLDLNVLREVRTYARDPNGEIPTVAGALNFIPAHLILADNRWAWALLDNLRRNGLSRLLGIFNYMQQEAPSSSAPYCSHISVSSIEAAVDFFAQNPRQMVHTYSSAFGALLRDVERREYLGYANRVERPESDWMVHGFIARGDRIKMYAKTDRRVRWEYRFEKRAFDRLGISRALSDESPATFAAIFARCAEQASYAFSALRSRTQRIFNIDQNHTPTDLIAQLAGCTRDQSILRELLECLVYTDKVDHSRFNRGFVERLRKSGILQPSLARGHSCIRSEYIRALNELRRSQHNFFSARLLQPVAKHAVLPRRSTRRTATSRASAATL